MSGKRLHHYIPQFYLRGFTDPSVSGGKTPWLWVRHKESSAVIRKAPKNLAAEIGYYATETADGLDYVTVENELAAMESRAAFALRKFLDSPTGHRKIEPDLSAFVGWLAVRVPWFRRAAEDEWQRFLERAAAGREALPDDPDFSCSLVNVSSGEQRRFALAEAVAAIRSGTWQARLSKNQMIDVMRVQVWYFRFQHFSRLHWTVLTAPDGQFFLTSDRPIVWYVPGRGLADSPAALKQPGIELTVPVSRRFALLATAEIPDVDARIRPSDINRRTFLFCERFVASPREHEIWEVAA
jgi:hypothetical protein